MRIESFDPRTVDDQEPSQNELKELVNAYVPKELRDFFSELKRDIEEREGVTLNEVFSLDSGGSRSARYVLAISALARMGNQNSEEDAPRLFPGYALTCLYFKEGIIIQEKGEGAASTFSTRIIKVGYTYNIFGDCTVYMGESSGSQTKNGTFGIPHTSYTEVFPFGENFRYNDGTCFEEIKRRLKIALETRQYVSFKEYPYWVRLPSS